jgi:uncharacterized protein (DUF983 family)
MCVLRDNCPGCKNRRRIIDITETVKECDYCGTVWTVDDAARTTQIIKKGLTLLIEGT